jgi:hypothetical protein
MLALDSDASLRRRERRSIHEGELTVTVASRVKVRRGSRATGLNSDSASGRPAPRSYLCPSCQTNVRLKNMVQHLITQVARALLSVGPVTSWNRCDPPNGNLERYSFAFSLTATANVCEDGFHTFRQLCQGMRQHAHRPDRTAHHPLLEAGHSGGNTCYRIAPCKGGIDPCSRLPDGWQVLSMMVLDIHCSRYDVLFPC